MRQFVYASLMVPVLTAGGGSAFACEEYPGQPLPTIGMGETNLEPCDPGRFLPQPPVVLNPVMLPPAPEMVGFPGPFGGPDFPPPPRRKGCDVQEYKFSIAVVRVHRC